MRLATGSADALSGRHLSVHDDIDTMLEHIEEVREHDLYVMRPERLRVCATTGVHAPDEPRRPERRQHVDLVRIGYRQPASPRRDDRREPRSHRRHVPGSRRARRPVPGRAVHLPPASAPRWTASRVRSSRRDWQSGIESGSGVPNCAEWVVLQYATAKVGVILVNINPAYRAHELAYVLEQSGCRMLVSATEFKGSSYRAMVEEVRPGLPRLERVIFLETDDWEQFTDARCRDRRGRGRPAGGGAHVRRPDQHPVHERNDRLPEGSDAQPSQHPEQRLLRRRGMRIHRSRPRVHPGAALPLLRHGPRQPRVHEPRRGDGAACARLRTPRHAGSRRRGSVHELVRRAHDVHRRARARRLRRRSICPRCEPGSWPARRARSR